MAQVIASHDGGSDAKALWALQERIEGLAVGVATSDRAYNMFGTPHVVFANGAKKPEGAPAAAFDTTLTEMIERSFAAVRGYRDMIEGDAYLTWRAYPQMDTFADGGPMLYIRLSFDPANRGVESFAETPETLGERRSSRSHNGADWSPRDLLMRMLRDHDSGETPLDCLVVAFMGPKGSGFWSAAPNVIVALGLLAAGTASYGALVEKRPA